MRSPYSLDLDRRRFLGALAGATSVGALAACGTTPNTHPPESLDEYVTALAQRLHPGQRYRGVTETEVRQGITAVEHLMSGDVGAAGTDFGKLGFTLERIHDEPSRRDCILAAAEMDTDRAWGLLIIAPGTGPPDVLIEVPHPRADRDTEQIGLAVFRAVPGSALLIAGAHRRAAGGAADVAHQRDSLFGALADTLAERGSFQLQLHGFADDSLRGKDAVISTGAADVGARSKRLAAALDDADLEVCRAWKQRCPELEGRRNVQGKAAARRGQPFVHLELNNTTRMDPTRRSAVVAALAGALIDVD
ncbi:hypothetical protein [Mycolicibacterium sp. XJ870]